MVMIKYTNSDNLIFLQVCSQLHYLFINIKTMCVSIVSFNLFIPCVTRFDSGVLENVNTFWVLIVLLLHESLKNIILF